MDVKKELESIRFADKEIDCKLYQLERLRGLAESLQSANLSRDKVKGGLRADITNIVDNIVCLQEEINADIDSLVDLKREWLERIKVLDRFERVVLQKHYFENKTIEQVGREIGYSWRQTARINDVAVIRLQENL